MILLDTHTLVWLDEGNPRLGRESRKRIDEAFTSSRLAVSAISFWEVAMLTARKRLEIELPILDWRREIIADGVDEINVDGEIGISAVGLRGLHGDPADRIIIATATILDAELVTADQKILDWDGDLQRHDARR